MIMPIPCSETKMNQFRHTFWQGLWICCISRRLWYTLIKYKLWKRLKTSWILHKWSLFTNWLLRAICCTHYIFTAYSKELKITCPQKQMMPTGTGVPKLMCIPFTRLAWHHASFSIGRARKKAIGNQLRLFRHLIRTPPELISVEVIQTVENPRSHWKEYESIPPKEQLGNKLWNLFTICEHLRKILVCYAIVFTRPLQEMVLAKK